MQNFGILARLSYLILSKTGKDVAIFVVCCSCDWRFIFRGNLERGTKSNKMNLDFGKGIPLFAVVTHSSRMGFPAFFNWIRPFLF